MDRVRWSERAIQFSNLVDNPAIQKPALVQIGNKAIIVGEKITGEFIMASPCKVSGDRFDVMTQEIVLSSKHAGVWRTISEATVKKDGHVHRLSTKDLERIHKQDILNERSTPRSYICIRNVEAFELIARNNDSTIANGRRIERRMKQIDEDTEFEITDTGEVEFTPSEGERTSQDYVVASKSKQGTFLQLLLPGVVEQEKLVRNRVLRVLCCTTKSESRPRHFLLEVNEQPCEIRPIASEGSTELRYLHSTQNLYDYMLTYGNERMLYVKLLRGDPPIKAIEFDGYMVLKSTLNGDKIPICRVEDLEITLVSPDLPVRVRLPTKNEHLWRSLPEVRAAEVQCMQLSLALLARHESEMYVTIEADRNPSTYLQTSYNQEQEIQKKRSSSTAVRKHLEECEKIFSNDSTNHYNNNNNNENRKMKTNRTAHPNTTHSTERQLNQLTLNSRFSKPINSHSDEIKTKMPTHVSHSGPGKVNRTNNQQGDSYDHTRRTTIRQHSLPLNSSNFKTKTTLN